MKRCPGTSCLTSLLASAISVSYMKFGNLIGDKCQSYQRRTYKFLFLKDTSVCGILSVLVRLYIIVVMYLT